MNKLKLYSTGVMMLALLFASSPAKAAPTGAINLFNLTTVSPMGDSGGAVTQAPDIFKECKAFANSLTNKINDYYIVINGKEFKAGYYSVMYTPGYDSNNVKHDGYAVTFNVSKDKKTDSDYFNIDCAGNTNTVSFIYKGNKFGDWAEVATTERSFFIYGVDKKLKKIETKGDFKQTSGSEWGAYTYTTPWKSIYNNLDKKLVVVSESVYHEPRTMFSEYKVGGFTDYTKCVKSDMPFCFMKEGNNLVMYTHVGYGSKAVDFWVDSSVADVEEKLISDSQKDTVISSDSIMNVQAEEGYLEADYLGGSTLQNKSAYEQCVKFVDALLNKSFNYEVFINGGKFKVGSYSVLKAPQWDLNNIKTDGFNITLNQAKSLKVQTNYLTLNCRGDMFGVNFAYIGNKLGVKDENDVKNDKKLIIIVNNNKLKKIATKGTFKQTGGSEWGGYTYTTPWKTNFVNLDKKLVLVSELVSHEPKTMVSGYKVGGFTNYTKCLKSDKPFCFKKVGSKLVMYSRIGWGSKVVNFWVK